MRIAWVTFAAFAAGCQPADPFERIAEAPPGVRVLVKHGSVSWAIPTALGDLPERARRTVDFIMPDGEVTYCAALLGDHEQYWIEKRYGPERRSLITDGSGAVIRRTHGIDDGEIPDEIRAELLAGRGEPARIEAVLAGGREGLRAVYEADGVVVVRERWSNGEIVETRSTPAELRVRR